MQTIEIDWDKYPILQKKEPQFLAEVAVFAAQICQLSEAQKQKLALFKAAELLNALVQIREREFAPDRLGPERAAVSFKIVRADIRNRRVVLPNGDTVSLQEPELQSIIDEGCRLFHAGKTDPEQWERAMALSTAQYITLNTYLEEELDLYANQFQGLFPDTLVQAVKEKFIEPYLV